MNPFRDAAGVASYDSQGCHHLFAHAAAAAAPSALATAHPTQEEL
jgi:hypothetical protein